MSPLDKPILSAADAVARISDGATVAVGGAGAGHALPDLLLKALGERFRQTGAPRNLTLMHPFGVGDTVSRGLEYVAQPGLLKRVIGGHWSLAPTMGKLAAANEFEAYCLPGGVIVRLFYCAAAGTPGWMTHVGLKTFVDPRVEGGKLNAKAQEDIVELTERGGREWLFYPTIPIDIALIQGWQADPLGNISMNGAPAPWHNLAMAQAAKASGGMVLACAREMVEPGAIHPRDVRTPGCFVDTLTVDPEHGQTFLTDFDPAYSGDSRKTVFEEMEFGVRKTIARRAAMELTDGAVLNVGFGLPDGVITVAREQGRDDRFTTTIEHGQFGGVPAPGLEFGAVWNAQAIVETGHMFDFYHGRGVDQTYLGFLQIDRAGNVNVSKLGDRIVGVGGFIDISQKAKKAVFCGTLSVRADVRIEDGRVRYEAHGKPKFVERVTQITFSSEFARETGQQVYYFTEAASFRLGDSEIELFELAPGVDLERDVIPQLGFRPKLTAEVAVMPEAIFRP